MNYKFDEIMMKTALLWSEKSYCKRRKVGAVLSSSDGRILATGYNGTISGLPNICEDYKQIDECNDENNIIICPKCNGEGKFEIIENYLLGSPGSEGLMSVYDEDICPVCNGKGKVCNELVTNEFVLHAEQNIIAYCAKNGIAMKDTILYVTLSPCKTCAKLIIQSGIKRVVYKDEYRDVSGIEFLSKNGIIVDKIELKD